MKKTLEERFWPKVDKTDTCWNWTAAKDTDGYGNIGCRGTVMKAHRVSYEMANGPIGKGMEIDHKCHNASCVNPSHLRSVTKKQNGEHRRGANPNSKSGVLGVSWNKAIRKWHARVRHSGHAVHVGFFESIKEAEAAIVAKRNELFTHNDLDRAA